MDIIEDFLSKQKTENTKRIFKSHVKDYFKFLGVEPNKYIKDKSRNYRKDLEDYVYKFLFSEHKIRGIKRKYSVQSQANKFTAIKSFFDEYELPLSEKVFKKLRKKIGTIRKQGFDKIPTKDELQKILLS